LAWRGQIHGRAAIVAEVRRLVRLPGRRARGDAGRSVAGRIERRDVVVGAVVAGAEDVDDARAARGVDGGSEHAGGRTTARFAPAVGGHADVLAAVPEHPDVVEAFDRARVGARSGRVEELAREQLRAPVDADDAKAVVADGGHRARLVRPVSLVVHRIAVVVDRVYAVHVVHVPVAVVVDAVGRDL